MQAAVEARRAVDPGLDDPFRGLYLGDDDVDRGSGGRRPVAPKAAAAARREQAEAAASATRPPGPTSGCTPGLRPRPRRPRRRPAGGGPRPDVDHRFERLYGYLHDDVTRRRASIGLALELAGLHPADVAARDRFGPRGRLVEGAGGGGRRRPAVPHPGAAGARPGGGPPAGRRRPRPSVAGLLVEPVPLEVDDDGGLGRALAPDGDPGDPLLAYVVEEAGASGRSFAAAVLAAAGPAGAGGRPGAAGTGAPVAGLIVTARTLAWEARLTGAVLVAGLVDHLAERGPGAGPGPGRAGRALVLTGRRHWEPGWARRPRSS